MATHLIAFSCSLLDDARRPPSTQCAHSAPFNPASVLLERMSVPPHVRGVCLWLAHRQGRRERGRARLSWASFRGHRDRDDGGQDAEGEGAEQHRLDLGRRPEQTEGGSCSKYGEDGALRNAGSWQTAHRSAPASRGRVAEPKDFELNPTTGAHVGRFLAVSCRFERCSPLQRPSGHGFLQ